MRQASDQLHNVLENLTPEQQRQVSQINMPYLGYLFFRETITQALLGESEAAILYWMGKDVGAKLVPQSPDEIIFSFIRLGLGQLDPTTIDLDTISLVYELRHDSFQMRKRERLERSLQFEAGILAGAFSTLLQQEVEARVTIHEKEVKKEPYAEIRIYTA
ncbi:DUF2507 domain-containing protein [Brevibacillus daliensis]|uniref:DUF2507 domain-containing protein n=1 Tax=Brevibacillus daliensis TaxID=2892995 RepID=UPI001E6105D6|nr:DUF2507 domain-containing protein [Brevibacillus daliensis]